MTPAVGTRILPSSSSAADNPAGDLESGLVPGAFASLMSQAVNTPSTLGQGTASQTLSTGGAAKSTDDKAEGTVKKPISAQEKGLSPGQTSTCLAAMVPAVIWQPVPGSGCEPDCGKNPAAPVSATLEQVQASSLADACTSRDVRTSVTGSPAPPQNLGQIALEQMVADKSGLGGASALPAHEAIQIENESEPDARPGDPNVSTKTYSSPIRKGDARVKWAGNPGPLPPTSEDDLPLPDNAEILPGQDSSQGSSAEAHLVQLSCERGSTKGPPHESVWFSGADWECGGWLPALHCALRQRSCDEPRANNATGRPVGWVGQV